MMRILVAAGAKGKFVYMKELADAMTKLGVSCKLVKETDYSTGFPSKKITEWFSTNKKFKQLIEEFKPDAVVVDRQLHFGNDTIKAKIPLFVYLRGHYWLELHWARKTLYRDPVMRMVVFFRNRVAEKCFNGATAILPISRYLEKIVNERYPKKPTHILLEGMDSSLWYQKDGMKLKHPCVGLLQHANWWGKTKEMLILPKIIEALPNVTFYWAGDGQYKNQILPLLEKFDNFKFLGRIQYPDQVREYLTEIDIYALVTGLDTLGVTILEAMLMKKPVIATNVGAIPEIIEDGKTGYTIGEGDYQAWVDRISVLLNNKKIVDEMSQAGHKFVKDNFSWNRMATELLDIIKMHVKEKT